MIRYRELSLAMAALAALSAGGPAWAQCEESDKLIDENGAPEDHFGLDVSLSGNRALIAAPSGAKAPNEPGAAFVFITDGASWKLEEELGASDAQPQDRFGSSVAIQDDIAIVGASDDDDRSDESGSAYVFRHDGRNWIEVQKLLASDGAAGARFGSSVALHDDTLLVGAWSDNAAYVFRHDGRTWVEEQKLVPPEGSLTTFFGNSVAIEGDVAAGGGVAIDEIGQWWGSVHMFRYDGADWVHEQQLLVPAVPAAGFFGVPVDIEGDLTVVGAWLDPKQGVAAGSAVFFRHDGAAWMHEQTVYDEEGQVSDLFGCDVAIDGNAAIIGSFGDDEFGDNAGSAFLFHYDGAHWVQTQQLFASDGTTLDFFGRAVALADGAALIGASGADPFGEESGAAYIMACESPIECAADVTGDGVVNGNDLLELLGAWGECVSCDDCPADLDGDCAVGSSDLILLLGAWGACS